MCVCVCIYMCVGVSVCLNLQNNYLKLAYINITSLS